MLSWVKHVISSFFGGIDQGIRDFVDALLSGIAGVLDTLFSDVTRAWHDFTHSIALWATEAGRYLDAVYHQLERIITYDLPHFAYTAWWWVTHTAELAEVLFWHLLALLEKYAWTAARYLGAFFLALIWHNLDEFVAVIEYVIDAVL